MTARRRRSPSPADPVPGAAAPPTPGGWRLRAQVWGLMALFLGGAGAMGWIAKLGLVDTLADLRAGRSLVTFSARDAISPFLMVAMLAFFGMGLVARPVGPARPRRHRKAPPDPRDTAVAALLGMAVACLVLFPFGPPVADWWFARAAARAGYELCPPLEWEHHPQDRWRHVVPGRPPPRCPRTWEEADRMRDG